MDVTLAADPATARRHRARQRARFAAWAALAVALVAVRTMHVGAVAALVLIAVALLVACRARTISRGVLALVGVAGVTLSAIAGTAIFVRLVGSFDLLGPRNLGAIPPGLILALLLLGLGLLMLAWGEEVLTEAYPTWAPAAVGIAGVVASIFLWRALVLREEAELARRSASIASRVAQAVRREVETTGQVLHQFALHEGEGDDTLALIALTQLRPDVPAATVLAILDSSGTPRVALPELAAAAPIAAAVPLRAMTRPVGQASVALLPIPNDTTRLVIHAATCVAGACHGGVAAIVSTERLLQRSTNELSAGWNISIGVPSDSDVRVDDNRQIIPLALGDLNWALISTPTPVTIGALRSTLPEVALILGLILSALLSVTVRLGDRALRSARTVERMRLSAALDRATEALWEWDIPAGSLVRSNELWRYMGFDPENRQHSLEEWIELVHPDDRDRVTAALWQHVDQSRTTFEAEYRVATPGGDWHIVVDRGRAVERDATGRATRILGITADVTRARRSDKEFHEIETLTSMGRVAARVAHEINNPLAGIRNAFLLIKDAVPEAHPHHHYVGAIEREVDRIAAVTRGLYETYRPEQEGNSTAVSTVIGDAVSLLTEMNRRARVTVATQLDGIPSALPLRGALLRQIVYNLVQNAIDASPPGGTVTLSARMNGTGLILEVVDQGPGVPESLRDRIFDPFYSTKGTDTANSGMGLGLAMVARSVSAAGGTITVDHAEPDGARFTVVLPLEHSSTEGLT